MVMRDIVVGHHPFLDTGIDVDRWPEFRPIRRWGRQ
jgi:hypothetical protein